MSSRTGPLLLRGFDSWRLVPTKKGHLTPFSGRSIEPDRLRPQMGSPGRAHPRVRRLRVGLADDPVHGVGAAAPVHGLTLTNNWRPPRACRRRSGVRLPFRVPWIGWCQYSGQRRAGGLAPRLGGSFEVAITPEVTFNVNQRPSDLGLWGYLAVRARQRPPALFLLDRAFSPGFSVLPAEPSIS